MHYYQFNIEAYRKDTVHLTPLEHGVYRLLLDTLYLTEVPLSLDKDRVMRSHCIRTKEEKRAFFMVLEEFFSETEKGFINDRAEKHLQQIYDKSEKARASAKLRWDKHDAKTMRTHSEGNANGMLPKDLITSLPHNTNIKDMSANANVQVVFDYWCSVMNKNGSAKLTDKRKSCIKARISDGYTIDQLKQAIDGCAKSSHHMGQNDSGTVYDDLTLICRSGDKVEFFINNIGKVLPGGSGGQNRPAGRRESVAERSHRQTATALARIEAEEANSSPVATNDRFIRE